MLVAALFAWLVFTATASANPLPVAGIYQTWGNDSGATASYVRGGQITLDWATIEPQRKTFNWSSLDSELKYYASIGKVATVQVNSTTKPAWLWNVVARCGSVQGQAAPQYWDPAYMTVQTELVSALAAHLKSSPYASTVALVRSAPNAIGTELTDLPSGLHVQGHALRPQGQDGLVEGRAQRLLLQRHEPVPAADAAADPGGAEGAGVDAVARALSDGPGWEPAAP